MNRSEILTKITTQLGSLLDRNPAEITENKLLFQDLDVDSLDILELIVALKEDFGISVSDGEVKAFLGELARFVPDSSFRQSEALSDEELAEVADKLSVATMVDFVNDRMSKTV